MEHWFDELTKKVATAGISRREMLGGTFAAGLRTLMQSSLGAQSPWLDALLGTAMADTTGCLLTRSGSTRTSTLTYDDRSGAVLRSTVAFKPGRKTARSAGWLVNSDATIEQGSLLVLRLKVSAQPGKGQIELDFGKGFKGAKSVRLEILDKKHVTGSIDGHALAPFAVGAKPKLADGRPLPSISVEPVTKATVERIAHGAEPVQKRCGAARVASSIKCDLCSAACGANFFECLLDVAAGAWWQLPTCYSNDDDCYTACDAPGGACCAAACDVDGGCCVNDGETCCGTGSLALCCAPNQSCCGEICCPAGFECRIPNAGTCCRPGDFLCPSGLCCQAGGQCCGDQACCAPGTHCAYPKYSLCCPDGSVLCGTECCGPQGQFVCLNKTLCCKQSDVCGSTCCPGGPCINGQCCPPPSHQCGKGCCPPFATCCRNTCCGPNDVCLQDRSGQIGCCPRERACGVGGDGPICCPAGQQCIDNHEQICAPCPSGNVPCSPETQSGFGQSICCPPNVTCCNTSCCKPGQICCKPLDSRPFGCWDSGACVH